MLTKLLFLVFRNVGAMSYAICNPIKEHQSAEQSQPQRDVEQGRDSDLSMCEDGATAGAQATTPTERSPLLVQPQAETGGDLPDWTAFLTSTPMQQKQLQPVSSSASSSTTASQDALHSLNVSRTRQLFALSTMSAHPTSSVELSSGYSRLFFSRFTNSTSSQHEFNLGRAGHAPLRDLDTPTSNSSSSSTTDSTEGEAVRLLPLPPRILPQSLPLRSPPTLTTSVSTTISTTSLPQPPGCFEINTIF